MLMISAAESQLPKQPVIVLAQSDVCFPSIGLGWQQSQNLPTVSA
ncbi:hypothetical protein [Shimia thalassica]|nr:hypothetical protein [Shimia thalassica]